MFDIMFLCYFYCKSFILHNKLSADSCLYISLANILHSQPQHPYLFVDWVVLLTLANNIHCVFIR